MTRSGVTVWLTEKRSACEALAEVLGVATRNPGYVVTRNGDLVTHNIGHLLRQKAPRDIDPRWGFAYEHLPIDPGDIPLEPEPDKRSQLRVIEDLFRREKIRRVVLAGDAGREGSLIGRETIGWLGFAGPLERMAVVSYEPGDIRAAIDAMAADSGDRDHRVYLEGLARQQFDYWLGMTGSVVSVLRFKPAGLGRGEAFSSGGVLSPLTALIVDREEAIRRFVPRHHYQVLAELRQGGRLRHPTCAVLPSGEDRRLYDRDLAQRIADAARTHHGPLLVRRGEERVGPPKLFDKAALVAKAGTAFAWSPTKVLQVAQSLYDHPHALITYPRTESAYLKIEQAAAAKGVLEALAGLDEFAALLRPVLEADGIVIRQGSRYNSAKVGEHHAIIPTARAARLARLSEDESALYLLIARTYIANHLPDAVDDKTRLSFTVTVDGEGREFAASGRIQRDAGWRRVFQDPCSPAGTGLDEAAAGGRAVTPGAEGEEEQGRLPDLADGTPVEVHRTDVQGTRTQPPPRYREADLEVVMQRLIEQFDDPAVKAMLANRDDPDKPKGLGTAATRGAAIAKVIEELGYVKRLQKKPGGPVAPTEKGYAHVFGWRAYFPAMVDPVTRARMEGDLARIGDASTTAEARRLAEDFLASGRRMLTDMVAACREARPFDVTRLGMANPAAPPSRDRIDAVERIARAQAIDLRTYPGWREDAAVARKFLDDHPPCKAEDRPPSERQADLVRRLAEERDEDAAPHLVSAAAASAYIDRCFGTKGKASSREAERGRGTGPASSAAGKRGGARSGRRR